MQKPTLYLKNAMLLTLSGFVLRGVGMLFRVWLAAWIGAEGMGLYQLALSVYNLAVTFATAGISVAATRLVAEELAGEQPGRAAGALGPGPADLPCKCRRLRRQKGPRARGPFPPGRALRLPQAPKAAGTPPGRPGQG